MDNIIFQSSNQNSVYVLNSNYRYYGNFKRRNFIGPNDMINKNQSQCQHASPTRSSHRTCSAGPRPLQHKLRDFGKFCDIPEAIGNPVTTSPSLLPATDAFQKYFNCSYATNVGVCDSFHALHADCCCEGGVGVQTDARPMQNTSKIKSNNSNKKNNINLKPSLIAKKTKFRKFLEEEKWRTADECIMDNRHQYNHNNCGGCTDSSTRTEFRTNSSVKESNADESTTLTASMAAMATCGPLNNIVKHYWKGKIEASAAGRDSKKEQQNQSNNWSGSGDSNNQQQQTQQQLEVLKSSQLQKNNYELYKEATEFLGFPCTFCDNCRCLECQSTYFDCDDSDSFSEVSNSDEYDEDIRNVLNNSVELVMYANCYSDATMKGGGVLTIQRQRQKSVLHFQEHQQSNFTCADENCNGREICAVGGDSNSLAVSGVAKQADVINQNGLQSIQNNDGNELENCTSFIGLNLRDANAEMSLDTCCESRGLKHRAM